MQSLQIDGPTAKKLFTTAAPEFKKMLTERFGEKYFSFKITDKIKTWEDAAAEYGIDPVKDLPYSKPMNSFQEAANAFFKLDIIATVLNEGVILDWADENQKKWYAWFNNYQPGSGFSFNGTSYGWTGADTTGGARLCVHSEELARYFGKQFLPIFNQFLNPNK